MRTLEFVVVFWGAKYRQFFRRFCLASLMAPNNFPAFSKQVSRDVVGRLIICTTLEDYESLKNDALFVELTKHVELEFINIGWPPADNHPIFHMSLGHKLALFEIIKRGSYASYLAPDIILADGSIATLIRYVSAGAPTVLLPALRFDFDKAVAELTQLGVLDANNALTVTPRELARVGTISLHSELQRFDFDANHYSDYPISTVFADPGKGLIVHTSSWGMAAVDLSQLKDFNQDHFDRDTIDAHFINDHIAGLSDAIYLTDSDEFFMLPLTSEEDMPQSYLLRPDAYLKDVADRAFPRKISYARKFLFCSASDDFKREATKRAVRIHHADLGPSGADTTSSRANAVIETALAVRKLETPIYFVVALADKRLCSLFLEYCLPSLLSPRNMPELAGIRGCRMLVFTTAECWEDLSQSWFLGWLQSYISVEFVDTARYGVLEHDELVSEAHTLAFVRERQREPYISVLMPSQIFADGMIARLIELANAGYDAVLAMVPPYDRGTVHRSLQSAGYFVTGRPIDIGPRELMALSFDGLRQCDCDAGDLADPLETFYVAAPAGVVMHGTRWTVLLAKFRPGVWDEKDPTRFERELYEIYRDGRAYCVTESDEINIVSLASEPITPEPSMVRRYRLSGSGLRNQLRLAKYLKSQEHRHLARVLYGLSVRLHCEDLTPVWGLAEARARALVQGALSHPVAYDAAISPMVPVVSPRTRLQALSSFLYASGQKVESYEGRLRSFWINLPLATASLIRLVVRDRQFRAKALKKVVTNPRWALQRLRAHFGKLP